MMRSLRKRVLSAGSAVVLMGVAASSGHAMSLNLELWELTGGPTDPFAREVYLCGACTLEQFNAVPLPGPNWAKNASDADARLFLPDSATNTPPMPPPGTPAALDLVPELPGDDHFLVARVLSGALLGVGAQGVMANAQVARGTTLTYLPGRIVHKLTDPSGDEWVLFSMQESATALFDPSVVDGLAGMSVPTGWSYASEVLAQTLTVTTPGGIADIFTASDFFSFQKIAVPEPARPLLLGSALLAVRRRRVA